MDEQRNDRLLARVEQLERAGRRWRLAGIAMAVAGVVIALAGAAQQVAGPGGLNAESLSVRDLEVRKLVLKDDRGNAWFSLESREGIPQMEIKGDVDGKPGEMRLVQLVVGRDQVPYLAFNGKGGGILLGVNPKGEPHLSLGGKGGMIQLGMGEDGGPRLVMTDKDGKERVRLRLAHGRSGALEWIDPQDAPGVQPPQGGSKR
jgi:hypothetical protein